VFALCCCLVRIVAIVLVVAFAVVVNFAVDFAVVIEAEHSMKPILTFVIPVRHPRTVSNWSQVKLNLAQTLQSIAAQTSANWNAIVVANHEADLPDLPKNVHLVQVDFVPPPLPSGHTQEELYEHIRADKGRRILAGLLAMMPQGFVMVVDYDDFVSNRLAAFVEQHPDSFGWYLNRGYLYDGGRILLAYPDKFHKQCGTSHIIRADLLGLPATAEEANETYIRRRLGSHIFVQNELEQSGTPLSPLPFPGALYRVGYADSAVKSGGIRDAYFRRWRLRKQPVAFARNLTRLRHLNDRIRAEFFGPSRLRA
jgi:hypothetical protein